jgi:hypothetical protein
MTPCDPMRSCYYSIFVLNAVNCPLRNSGVGNLLKAQTMRELTDHNQKRPIYNTMKQTTNYERAKRDKELMNFDLSSLT